MPRYKKYLILASFLFLVNGCAKSSNVTAPKIENKTYKKVEHRKYSNEDFLILSALEFEKQKYFKSAQHSYLKLFNKTNKYEYLVRYLSLTILLDEHKTLDDILKEHIDKIKDIKEEDEILRLYTFSLISKKKIDEAFIIVQRLLEINDSSVNNALMGNIYLEKKDYKKAYEYISKSNEQKFSKKSLVFMTNVQYHYLDEKEQAKKTLETYINKNGYDYNISFQLLKFYETEKNTEKLLDLLSKMNETYKKEKKIKLARKVQQLIVSYYFQKDKYKAIEFLEKEDPTNLFLISLYKNTNQNKKVISFLEKAYAETKNPNYLAQLAVFKFEEAEDKKTVLKDVIADLKKALKNLKDPVYQNYLAYLLVDYDVDVSKGIKLVKEALKKEPKNIAYIDTLAWGQFKVKDCKNALKNMEKIKEEALKEEEIKLHWEIIKRECK